MSLWLLWSPPTGSSMFMVVAMLLIYSVPYCLYSVGNKITTTTTILPKGPYPLCLRMTDRALLAGYPRIIMCPILQSYNRSHRIWSRFVELYFVVFCWHYLCEFELYILPMSLRKFHWAVVSLMVFSWVSTSWVLCQIHSQNRGDIQCVALDFRHGSRIAFGLVFADISYGVSLIYQIKSNARTVAKTPGCIVESKAH